MPVFRIYSFLDGRILGLSGLVPHFGDYPHLSQYSALVRTTENLHVGILAWLGGGGNEESDRAPPRIPIRTSIDRIWQLFLPSRSSSKWRAWRGTPQLHLRSC